MLGRLSLEFERIGKIAHLAEMYKEIEILRKEVEFQKRLAEHWEGRWKQEYSEKIELLHKNIELKKKYEGIPEEVRSKFGLVPSSSQMASQDIPSNKDERGEGSVRDHKGKRKEMDGNGVAMRDKGRKKKKNGHFKKKCVAPKCETCNKSHTGICYVKIGACFRCGQLGHQVRNCPEQMNFGMVKLL